MRGERAGRRVNCGTDALGLFWEAMRHLLLVVGILLGAGICAGPQAGAQDNQKVQYFLLEETTVRGGMGGQFEAAQKDYCAAVVRGGAPACLVFSTATFGKSGLYWTLLPFSSFIHYDQGKYTDKGLTPEQAKELSARRVPTIESNKESAIALELDSSLAPSGSNGDYPLNVVTEYQLKPGMTSQFLGTVKKTLLPGAKKGGAVALEVFTTRMGESPERVLVVTRHMKFEELDGADAILAGMSKLERNTWESLFATFFQHRETYVMRYRADISDDPRAGRKLGTSSPRTRARGGRAVRQ